MYQDNTQHQTGSGAAASAVPAAKRAPGDHRLIIESRFGTLAIAPENGVKFPEGLLGFGELHGYAVADLPDQRYPQLKVLQCLDDHQLSFLVLPLEPEAGIILRGDIAQACDALSIEVGDLAILLIVTVRKTSEGVTVSANLRAPLMIDSISRTGAQYVIPNDRYPVRYALS